MSSTEYVLYVIKKHDPGMVSLGQQIDSCFQCVMSVEHSFGKQHSGNGARAASSSFQTMIQTVLDEGMQRLPLLKMCQAFTIKNFPCLKEDFCSFV